MNVATLIYGAGAVGRNVRMILKEAEPDTAFDGFLDDREPSPDEQQKLDGPYRGGMEYLQSLDAATVYVAVADCAARRDIVARLRDTGKVSFPQLLHPRAWIADRTRLGEGSILYPCSMVDVDVTLGAFAIVNMQSSIGHDTCAGDFLTLSPAVAIGGNVTIGHDVFFGIQSGTIQGLSIGAGTHIGAGAMVLADIPPGKKVRAARSVIR